MTPVLLLTSLSFALTIPFTDAGCLEEMNYCVDQSFKNLVLKHEHLLCCEWSVIQDCLAHEAKAECKSTSDQASLARVMAAGTPGYMRDEILATNQVSKESPEPEARRDAHGEDVGDEAADGRIILGRRRSIPDITCKSKDWLMKERKVLDKCIGVVEKVDKKTGPLDAILGDSSSFFESKLFVIICAGIGCLLLILICCCLCMCVIHHCG